MAKRTVLRGLHPLDRFFHRVEITDTCWLWRGATTQAGYGTFTVKYPDGRIAHRYAYEQLVGPIPDGLVLDHLCRTRACVNPDHLEPVTHAENMRRSPLVGQHLADAQRAKTHCLNGHPYAGKNLRVHKGRRYCRACQKANAQAFYERKRNAA
jgi:hypothetical protein